ncbi:hypothetical protein C8T65DRAFT_627346 [Cerioporus squamosus]|nr:hypothetical protein C8T65DRAFT_627346 [Cerioporus squamosus]
MASKITNGQKAYIVNTSHSKALHVPLLVLSARAVRVEPIGVLGRTETHMRLHTRDVLASTRRTRLLPRTGIPTP